MTERSRKNEAVILQGLQRIGQVRVAKELGVSEATISRFKDSNLQQVAEIIAACELKIVPQNIRCYSEDSINAMLILAGQRMDQLKTASDLEEE